MVARGHAWLPGVHVWLPGAMRGCWGACMVAKGGVHGCWGLAWLPGGMHGCWEACIGYDEIRAMIGRYASYWNAFLCDLFLEHFICTLRLLNLLDPVNHKL